LKTILRVSLAFLVFVSLLPSCASQKKNVHFEFTEVHSKPGLNIKKGKLGIIGFDCVVPSFGNEVSDVVGTYLINSQFTVVEREYLAQILQEHELSADGSKESINYKQIGKLSSLDYLLVGDVSVRSPRWRRVTGATARLLDLRAGELLVSVVYTPPRKGWAAPNYMGEALAEAIKREVTKTK